VIFRLQASGSRIIVLLTHPFCNQLTYKSIMKSSKKIIAVAAVAVVAFASQSLAQTILVSDNFDRADGSLTGTVPTPGPGGAWADHSGTTGDLLITSGQAVLNLGGGSEDTHVLFAGQTTGVLSANFDLTVSAAAAISGGDYEYFAHFMTEGNFNFRSRLDVVEATGGGDFTLGIASGSGTAETIFPTDFSFNTPINVTLSFDLDTGIGSVEVGGTAVSGTGTFLGENLDSFALRQSFSSSNEMIMVDNLVVSVPEPSTYALALGALGLVIVLIRRRR
jgi:hypothetical protein